MALFTPALASCTTGPHLCQQHPSSYLRRPNDQRCQSLSCQTCPETCQRRIHHLNVQIPRASSPGCPPAIEPRGDMTEVGSCIKSADILYHPVLFFQLKSRNCYEDNSNVFLQNISKYHIIMDITDIATSNPAQWHTLDATTINNCHPTHHDVVALCCTFVADNLDDVYSGFLGLVSAGDPSFYACILAVQIYCHDKPRYCRMPSSHNTKHGSLFGQQVAHLQCMPDGCRLVQNLGTSLSNLVQCIQHILKYHHAEGFFPCFFGKG